jgi:serine/threonine-protein kinase RsbT
VRVVDVPFEDVRVAINRDSDIVDARQKGRELAARIGLSGSDQTLLATAISEIARNIVVYAERGEVSLGVVERGGVPGILIIARDQGPGIADIDSAMRDGFSTGKSLGLGLPGAKRLVDEFEIVSDVGKGTTVTMRKWKR